jgi:DNA-directed RNA polymerase
MTRYSGWQWLLIDAATQYGKDKLTFEERIKWTEEHLHDLEFKAYGADNYPLFMKAVMAIRKAQKGLPTGHMVGVDGCCSGIQVMSVLTGCVAGATATGLVDPDRRADAYSSVTEAMKDILGNDVDVSRTDAKQAVMTLEIGVTV